jgi:hypothetical protein
VAGWRDWQERERRSPKAGKEFRDQKAQDEDEGEEK